MGSPKIYILPTAIENYYHAIRETERIWGRAQAKKYRQYLKEGIQEIPEQYKLSANRSDDRTGTSDFRLHRVQHHYVAYKVKGDKFVIGTILHERMNIPEQLKAIERITDREYAVIMGRPPPTAA